VLGRRIALHQGTLLLKLLHGWLLIALTLWQEKTTAQHIHCGIMHLLPTMKTATLTQCSNSVGEGVVQVMEEHLIETMFATQQEGHDLAEHRITAGWILRQELVPPMGMVEVGEERPGDGEASSASNGHRQEETPALREGPSKWPGVKEPHTGPKACYEKAMTETVGNPLAPEVLVALTSCTLIWEVGVPKESEQTSSVIGT